LRSIEEVFKLFLWVYGLFTVFREGYSPFIKYGKVSIGVKSD